MKHFLMILATLMILIPSAQAQIFEAVTSVSLAIAPEFPEPNSEVRARIITYSFDLDRASVEWVLNGRRLGAGIGLGYVLGPAIGGVLMVHEPALPYFLAAGLALANSLSALVFLPAPPRAAKRDAATDELSALAYAGRAFRHPRLGHCLWIVFFTTLTFSLFTGTFALLGQHRFAFTPRKIGLLMSFIGLMAAMVQGGLIGPLVKRFGELRLVATGALMFAASMALLPAAHSLWTMLAALALLGLGNGLNGPAILALISHEAAADEQGRLLGFEQSLESIARILGLVVGGWLFAQMEWVPYAFGAVLMTVGCALAVLQIAHRKTASPA